MGCGGSKDAGGAGAPVKTEEIDMSVNKEKRMSVTKRRVAVRYARRRVRCCRPRAPHVAPCPES